MQRVYKYPVPNSTTFKHHMPQGARFLRVAQQHDIHQMWFLIDEGAPPVFREFRLFGTGQDIAPGHEYLFTYDSGPFVLHLFEVMK